MKKFTIGVYTTLRNAVSMNYPFEESIKSVLGFCDEVVVLDTSDGTDATPDRLEALRKGDSRVNVMYANKLFDWNAPNHGVFDGQTKAMARSVCKSDFLYQHDGDEVIHELDAPKIRPLIEKSNYLQQCPILALPVIEYWGSSGKVRMDVNPWKWRISKNLPDITHGIPVHLRRTINGLLYAAPHSTDGCNMISKKTGQDLGFMSFMTDQDERLRQSALVNNKMVPTYQKWFNLTIEQFPGVHHYSWFSIARKIRHYKMFWNNFWKSMYNIETNEKDNPFFPGKLWSEVTEEMIQTKAKELSEKTSGHVFHVPWKGTNTTGIKIERDHPQVMKEWIKLNT